MVCIRAARVPADPNAIARTLAAARRPGLAVLVSRPQGATRRADARFSFVACDPVDESDDLVPPAFAGPDPRGGSGAGYGGAPAAPRWIGVIPYEALRGLERPAWTRDPDDRAATAFARPVWHRYAAAVRVDHATGEVSIEADDAASAAKLARVLTSSGLSRALEPSLAARPSHRPFMLRAAPDEPREAAEEAHRARVREALRLIAAGDLYEVNLARRILLQFHGDMLALFESLLDAAPAPWGFLLDLPQRAVCATSPELALSVRGDVLRTCPIKGTRPRGADAGADARLAGALASDEKERAELTMAVDVHRNDLGRVAVPGSVRVLGEPRLVGGRTVWSRVAEVVARRAPQMTLADIARAVLPCGSVTGAPKVRAMEVIARLEPWRRGAYTGAFGYVGRDGGLELAMAIRTIQLEGGPSERVGSYFTGGGIVADSAPERELEETRWKAAQLERLAQRAGPDKSPASASGFVV
jgi:anthranilate/para-aminobenzoate synthase component I